MRFVDVIGLPGSGKTTLTARIIAQSKRTSHTLLSSNEGLALSMRRIDGSKTVHACARLLPPRLAARHAFSLFLRSGYYETFLLVFLAEYGDSLGSYLSLPNHGHIVAKAHAEVLKYFLRGASRFSLLSAGLAEREVVVFDESLSQRAIGFFTDVHVQGESIDEFVDGVPQPDLVVRLKVAPKECMRRMFERSQGVPERLRELPRLELLDVLTQMEDVLARVARRYEQAHVRVTEVDSQASVEKWGPLEEAIESLFQQR